jgi:hypothetical protein
MNKYAGLGLISVDNPIPGLIDEAADRYGVPRNLAHAVATMESNYNPRAKSPVGAIGVMQLMPGTARDLGVRDPWDPAQNVEGGVKYLAQLSEQFNGDPSLVMAGYNAGPGAVIKSGMRVPKYRETQNYVARGNQLMRGSANREADSAPATADSSNKYAGLGLIPVDQTLAQGADLGLTPVEQSPEPPDSTASAAAPSTPTRSFGEFGAPGAAPRDVGEIRQPTQPPLQLTGWKPPEEKPAPKTWGGFGENVLNSLDTFLTGLISPVTHPVATTQNISNLMLGMTEATGMKGIPGQSHLADVQGLADMYKERYGSVQGFKDAFYKDPMAILTDLATAVSAGTTTYAGAADMLRTFGLAEDAAKAAQMLKGAALATPRAAAGVVIGTLGGAVKGGAKWGPLTGVLTGSPEAGLRGVIGGAGWGALKGGGKGIVEGLRTVGQGATAAGEAFEAKLAEQAAELEKWRAAQRFAVDRPPPERIGVFRLGEPPPGGPSPGPPLSPQQQELVRKAQQAGAFTPEQEALTKTILENVEPQVPAPPAAPPIRTTEATAPETPPPATPQAPTRTIEDIHSEFAQRMAQLRELGAQRSTPAVEQAISAHMEALRQLYAEQPIPPGSVEPQIPPRAQPPSIQTRRKPPATATEAAPPGELESQLAESLATVKAGKRPTAQPAAAEGPRAPTASETRVEGLAQHLAADTGVDLANLEKMAENPKSLAMLEELGRALDIKGRPTAEEIPQIVERVKQLRSEASPATPEAPQNLRTLMEGGKAPKRTRRRRTPPER